MLRLLNVSLALAVFSSAVSVFAAPPTPGVSGKPVASGQASGMNMSAEVAGRLQTYFSESRKELGPMEPWQSKLFEEEALPEYLRFIRDYRSAKRPLNAVPATPVAAPTIEAEIDFDGLKQFLRFYAPKSLRRENPSIAVLLRAQPSCAKCVAALPEVRTIVGTRLERRGLKVLWANPAELGGGQLTGKALDDAAGQYAIQKKAVGALVMQLQIQNPEDIDAAHADENHYVLRSSLVIRDVAREEAEIELTETGSFERSTGKILTDAFTGVGGKIEKLEISQSELKREEMLLQLTGVKSFFQYQLLKSRIQDALKSVAAVDDQRIARGKATLTIHTQSSLQGIQSILSKLKVDGMRIGSVKVEGQEIFMEILPLEGAPQT